LTSRNQTSVTVTITAGNVPNYRKDTATEPNPHNPNDVEVIVSAAAFPGLGSAQTTINLAL
jgi:hypothetical protein